MTLLRRLFPLLLLYACTNGAPRHPQPAFYYWKTTFRLSPPERAYLDSLDCRTLYVKFLDVGRGAETGGAIRPLALLGMADTSGLAGKTIVPCVFLTNSVFQEISLQQIDWLAERTSAALRSVGRQFPDTAFAEFQFDCDWTATTRAAYFSYLQKVKAHLPPGARLSATIRLHQYKLPDETGVPPVDRGMLMFYNTGTLDDPAEQNSIFDPKDAEAYLDGAPGRYPLPLDVALPVFSWGVVFRDGELFRLIDGLAESELGDTARFGPVDARRWEVQQNTFVHSLFLRPGDTIRLEGLDADALERTAALATGTVRGGTYRMAFFDLDLGVVDAFPVERLRGIGGFSR